MSQPTLSDMAHEVAGKRYVQGGNNVDRFICAQTKTHGYGICFKIAEGAFTLLLVITVLRAIGECRDALDNHPWETIWPI